MAVTTPGPCRMKPRAGSTPDLSHPYASGLVEAYLLNEGSGRLVTDCVSLTQGFFRNGTPTWVPTACGGGVRFNGSSDIANFDHPRFGYGGGSGSAGPYAILAGVRVNSVSGFGTIYASGNTGLYVQTGPTFTNYNVQATATTLTLNTPILIGTSAEYAKPVYMLMNGVLDGFTASPGNVPIIDPTSLIGGHGGEYFNGDISFIYVYNRYVPPELMAAIQADPFAMFEAPDDLRRVTCIGAAVARAGAAVASTFAALTVAP